MFEAIEAIGTDVDRLWRRWSPNYTPNPDYLRELKHCLRASMPAPLGYYRALRPSRTIAGAPPCSRAGSIAICRSTPPRPATSRAPSPTARSDRLDRLEAQ